MRRGKKDDDDSDGDGDVEDECSDKYRIDYDLVDDDNLPVQRIFIFS